MRRLLRITALTLVLTLLATTVAFAAQRTYELQVDGLACPFCAYGIEKQLSAIEGVKELAISLGTGTVTVTMDEGSRLEEGAAGEAVKAAGFSLRGFQEVQATPQN